MTLRLPSSPNILLALALVLVPLGACQSAPDEPPLKGATIGGAFTLTDQDGKRVSDTAYNGRYRIVYFGYASCPDVCPTDLATIGQGLRAFEASDPDRAQRVQPIFITVDPSRDTPPVLKAYVANFHPRLVGLTGSEQEIEAAKRVFRVFSSRGEPSPAGGYLVNHSNVAYLMGPDGEPIALLPQDQGADAIKQTLDQWVR